MCTNLPLPSVNLLFKPWPALIPWRVSADPSIAKHKPYVFIVGTHKDCLVNELGEDNACTIIAEIDSQLKSLICEAQV